VSARVQPLSPGELFKGLDESEVERAVAAINDALVEAARHKDPGVLRIDRRFRAGVSFEDPRVVEAAIERFKAMGWTVTEGSNGVHGDVWWDFTPVAGAMGRGRP